MKPFVCQLDENKSTSKGRGSLRTADAFPVVASLPPKSRDLLYSGRGRGGRQPEVKCSILGIISIMPQRRPEV